MEDVEEHRFYLPGAASRTSRSTSEGLARFEVAERIGGGGDLVGLRPSDRSWWHVRGQEICPLPAVHSKKGAARAAPKLEAARGQGGRGGAAYPKRIGTSAWARRSVRGGLTSTYILFTLAAMVENVIKTAGPTHPKAAVRHPRRRHEPSSALFARRCLSSIGNRSSMAVVSRLQTRVQTRGRASAPLRGRDQHIRCGPPQLALVGVLHLPVRALGQISPDSCTSRFMVGASPHVDY